MNITTPTSNAQRVPVDRGQEAPNSQSVELRQGRVRGHELQNRPSDIPRARQIQLGVIQEEIDDEIVPSSERSLRPPLRRELVQMAPLYQEGALNSEAFGQLMRSFGDAMVLPHREPPLAEEDMNQMRTVKARAHAIAEMVEGTQLQNKLWFKRYQLDQDGLYEELRKFSAELNDAGRRCASETARVHLQTMAAAMELLAQQHNTVLIARHYDTAARELAQRHGLHFQGARVPNQSLSNDIGVGVAVGGKLGGSVLELVGKGNANWSTAVTTDFDGSPGTVASFKWEAGLKGGLGTGVLKTNLVKAELEGAFSRTTSRYTEHPSHEAAFQGLVSDGREGYILKSPLLHFDRLGYDPKALAKAEMTAINMPTTWGPLNAVRNSVEGLSRFLNREQTGLTQGWRPFNELSFLKAQGGASKDLMKGLLSKSESAEVRALGDQLYQVAPQQLTTASNKTHHSLMGTITTNKLSVSGKAGWNEKQMNPRIDQALSEDAQKPYQSDHPVGMGGYAKLSAWRACSTYDFSLIKPPHEVVTGLAEHDRDGAQGVLEHLLHVHPQFQTYVESIRKTIQETDLAAFMADDLKAFRREGARMQAAKALLLNTHSRRNPVLEQHAWEEFKAAHDALGRTFDLPSAHFPHDAPHDEQARIDLVSRANGRLGEAWTALSLGQAQARLLADGDEAAGLDALAAQIKDVDVAATHPLIAYAHSPIRLQSTDYQKVENGGSCGGSFEVRLPSPISTTDADKTGPGALKGLLITQATAEGGFGIKWEHKSGHPSPVRNGTFRTTQIDLKLQIPPVPTNPGVIKRWVDLCCERAAEAAIQAPEMREEPQEAREAMAHQVRRDLGKQLQDLFSRGHLPTNGTLTFEWQSHRMDGTKAYVPVYFQMRGTVETQQSPEMKVSDYFGWAPSVAPNASAKSATTVAGLPELKGSVYGHLLQFHDKGLLKPLVGHDRNGNPQMGWDQIPHGDDGLRADLAKMYFSNDGVLDFLTECASASEDDDRLHQPQDNSAQILIRQFGSQATQEKWRNIAIDRDDLAAIRRVREHTKDMSPSERMHHYRTNMTAKGLFDRYLQHLEILQTCNNRGKFNPQENGWRLVAQRTS